MRQSHLKLNSWLALYVVTLIALLGILVVAERYGAKRALIGWTLIGTTIVLYAVLGFVCRTAVPLQYYVAGRSIPAFHNGMAAAADWISAASFVSLMGTIYATGYSANVFLMGWTGGFCLLAILVAPYMRKLGEFTLPDFMVRRYGGQAVRVLSALAVVFCCFAYVVAQMFAVGLIISRMIGVDFEIGIYLGLSSVLLCSFLGGMRAITWTQVAQYIVILLAVVIAVVWLSVKQTGSPWGAVDYRDVLQNVSQAQARIATDAKEKQLIDTFVQRISELDQRIAHPRQFIRDERQRVSLELQRMRPQESQDPKYVDLDRQLRLLNASEISIVQRWQTERSKYTQMLDAASSQLQPAAKQGQRNLPDAPNARSEQINFIALVLVLCLGTASMPHLLMRFQTTSSVAQTRTSVSWTLFFILAVYLCLPPLAMMVKLEVLTQIVGQNVTDLPVWITQWNRVLPELVSFSDVNQDGIVQARELYLGSDAVMLVMPEIAGMPYAFTALIAAGALAAALSTADGLLLAMTAVLSRDLLLVSAFGKSAAVNVVPKDEKSVRERGMLGSKVILLTVALAAAYAAAQKAADIVTLVTLAFSLTAAAFFVPIVAGIFWQRANRSGAIAAMMSGPSLTLYYYFAMSQPPLHTGAAPALWLGIQPVAAGVFGVALAGVVMILVTLVTSRRILACNEAVMCMRTPD